jgi:serine/threonine-protein kinase
VRAGYGDADRERFADRHDDDVLSPVTAVIAFSSVPTPSLVIGRYVLFDELASGGMARIYLGRMKGAAGFARTVAVKRLHPHFSKEPDFVAMLVDEARLASRISHPNVVPVLDVISDDDELCIVMEYVHGLSLSYLLKAETTAGRPLDLAVVSALVSGMLHGLHAAHEAKDERGRPLEIVHRDVSPHNVLVARDGTARIIDFGIARATIRVQTTREGTLKGKIPYMSPEQIEGLDVDRRTDIYAAGAVLYECVTGQRLFGAENEAALISRVLKGAKQEQFEAVDPVVRAVLHRALALDPAHRFRTAHEMADALERALPAASNSAVADWMARAAKHSLAARERRLAEIESGSTHDVAATPERPGSSSRASTTLTVPKATPGSEEPTNVWGPTVETHVSVGAHVRTPEPRERPLTPSLALIIAAGIALTGAGAGLGFRFLQGPKAEAPPAAASLVASSPPSSPVPVASPALPSETPSTTTTATAPPEEPLTIETPPTNNVEPRAETRPPPRATTRPPPKRPPSRCDPPYELDANGIRRIKAGCGQAAP